jgi:membrane fusion protein (multidrug efflux system)
MPSPIRAPALALAVAALLSACSGSNAEDKKPPPPEAGFITLKPQDVRISVELAGRTSAFEVSEVRPQVSGIIRSRSFTEGSLVRAGQTLYQIDPSLYQAAVAQAAANVANARATREAAQTRAARYRPLAAIEAVSKQDYTDAAAQAKQAAAAVAQQSAQMRTAQINLRFTRVPAPISGRIGRSMVTTGALVTSGQPTALTTIQRLDPINVDIQQSSADIIALRQALAGSGAVPRSAPVQLVLENGTEYGMTGTLEFAEPMVDPNTGTVTLRARFPNPQGLLLPGMFVRARIVEAVVHNAYLVPQQAVSRDPQGGATIIVVGPGNRAESRTVTAERTIGDKWLVTAGIAPGDRIVVEGLGKVRPGQPVRPVPAGSKSRRPGGPGGPGGGGGGRGGHRRG